MNPHIELDGRAREMGVHLPAFQNLGMDLFAFSNRLRPRTRLDQGRKGEFVELKASNCEFNIKRDGREGELTLREAAEHEILGECGGVCGLLENGLGVREVLGDGEFDDGIHGRRVLD